MILYPNAKINIGLNVVEKRADGYHNLETVFYPINLLDALEITTDEHQADSVKLKVSGEAIAGRPSDNLVMKACNLMRSMFPEKIERLSVHLHKHIPTGAGLGGGSSDAAFTIKALNEKFSLGMSVDQMEQLSAQLGADCPFFIKNQPVFAEGIGDIFTDIDIVLKGKTLVLVKPDISVSTADAYSLVSPHKPQQSLRESLRLPVEEWKNHVVNDFESSVFKKFPEIAAIKDRLYDLGALYASMSGSGSAVYGIFNQPVQYVDEVFAGYFCRQRELDV
ncbi:MAG: 4-(cytidine 5'-diphospho)-2-C-methyl-D-erythritol kinase [Bacteroidaceae bacterium]|jgi:4-diphosphocytidyl-2-C-methyl-D-erythritol kinase